MSYATSLRVAGIFLVLFAGAAPVSAFAAITGASLPGGSVGVYYAHEFDWCIGVVCQLCPQWSLSVTEGELPPGLSFGAARGYGNRARTVWYLRGTPTTAGTYTGTVTATCTTPTTTLSRSHAFSIVIVVAPPVITGSGPPIGSVGAPYTFNFAATGSPPITYKLTSGELPDGLTLSTAGLVSGTPTTAGSFAGTVTASNGTLPDGVLTFTITIAGPQPLITSSAPPDGSVGVPYTFSYTATGSVPITYNVTDGALPYGLTLSTAGVIDGTPTTNGTFTGTVTASNGISPDDVQTFSIVIRNVPPAFTNGPPSDGTVGTPYVFAYAASGTPPITYSVTAGALPDGLTLSSDGVIDGTPTTEGTYSGRVTASNGTAPDATQEFSITIILPGPLHITSSPPPGGAVGNPYTFTYTATGATNITYSVTSGELPPGLSLGADSAAGVLAGTPTTAGTYTGTVTAISGMAPDDAQDFSITIVDAAPVITSAPPMNAIEGTSYAFNYTATGSTPMSYRVTAGDLPDGMTLSADGLISGTPTTAGTFAGTVTVSNGILPDATQDFRIVVESTGDNAGGNNGGGGGGALDGITLIALLVLPLLRAVRRRTAGRPGTRSVCNRRLVGEFPPL